MDRPNQQPTVLQAEIFPYLPSRIRQYFLQLPAQETDGLEEIRIRTRKPLLCITGDGEYALDSGNPGRWTRDFGKAVVVTDGEVQQTVQAVSEHSRYAFEEDIRRGFITLPGGHRVGLSGQALCEDGKVRSLRRISGLSFRVARACKGCADTVIPQFYGPEKELLNVLIVSPPRCGKTTLLRDVCRQISDGNPYSPGRPVTVIDERSEIAGSFLGIPQLEVGIRTDVLDGCPKAEGILMALRALSPAAVITDEISHPEDALRLQECVFSGVSVITSVHAASFLEAGNRPGIRKLLQEHVFHRAIVLSRRNGPGTIEEIVRCYEPWTI